MKWRILDTGTASAQDNMETDRKFLEHLDEPILHFYDWKFNSITYGHFTEPGKFLNLQHADKWNLELARRPTGGGITFHLTDLAFSVLVPSNHEGYHLNIMENYAYINVKIASAIKKLVGKEANLLNTEINSTSETSTQFCSAAPTKYDVMWGNKKVGGGAQRRTKKGFLHQGTIFLQKPDDEFLTDMVTPHICNCISKNSEYLFSHVEKKQLTELRKIVREELIHVFTRH